MTPHPHSLHINLCISLCLGLWYNTLHERIKALRR